ncbi:hypothetical protein IQ07DRAFT_584576 [Pyrenochaeta sp. DS3sAY3a]|nr:hypothetical protein IQ07DRAFT_584576 [Pyrenochaeta sp. DS3sAY3a]
MATTRNARNYKRVSQACDNCRRKKIRCPGEKPACSHCNRLHQDCQYPSSGRNRADAQYVTNSHLEDRVAQLEERLDLVLEGTHDNGQPNELVAPTAASAYSASSAVQISSSGLIPDDLTMEWAIEIYYKNSHRQPLWLFNHGETLHLRSCEEILLTVLSIATQHPSRNSVQGTLSSPETYSDAARSMIMLRIASASINLPILQALCLLAYSGMLANDLSLASFHTMLARLLLRSSGIEDSHAQEQHSMPEEYRRLVWSIFLLEYTCGQPPKIPCTIESIHNPRYRTVEATLQRGSRTCLPLPLESYNSNDERSIGIWGHMVSILSLWTEIRTYVADCADGLSTSPWRPESTYTLVNSHILEIERTFPDFYRYDSAQFLQRSAEEILSRKEYWVPWMRVQVQYHTVHCVLNHPFLLSSMKPKTVTGTNAFWKKASKLTIVHSTWVSRLLEMAKEKGLPLSDPSLSYSAVVAATLHSFWCLASDEVVRSAARSNLEICRDFLNGWGPQWPVCGVLKSLLDQLINLMLGETSGPPQEIDQSKASIMWQILEFGNGRPEPESTGLFQSSFLHNHRAHDRVRQGSFSINTPDEGSISGQFGEIIGHFAAPPQLGDLSIGGIHNDSDRNLDFEGQADSLTRDSMNFPSFSNWTWPQEPIQGYQASNLRHIEEGRINLDWWDNGIL